MGFVLDESKIVRKEVYEKDGYTKTYGYDKDNNLIDYLISTGFRQCMEYDDKHHVIKFITYPTLFEYEQKYDRNGNKTFYKDSKGKKEIYTYDDEGKMLTAEYFNHTGYHIKYVRDKYVPGYMHVEVQE